VFNNPEFEPYFRHSKLHLSRTTGDRIPNCCVCVLILTNLIVKVLPLKMSTTLCEVLLFNDTFCWTRQGLILNRKLWGESKIAERERERERWRGRVLLQIGGGVSNKFGSWRKYLRWI